MAVFTQDNSRVKYHLNKADFHPSRFQFVQYGRIQVKSVNLNDSVSLKKVSHEGIIGPRVEINDFYLHGRVYRAHLFVFGAQFRLWTSFKPVLDRYQHIFVSIDTL